MTIYEAKIFTFYQGFLKIGAYIPFSLAIYGFITSLFLPYLFYDKLSIYLLNKKLSDEKHENIKNDYDQCKNIFEMDRVFRKIFSFERITFISNQVDAFQDIIT